MVGTCVMTLGVYISLSAMYSWLLTEDLLKEGGGGGCYGVRAGIRVVFGASFGMGLKLRKRRSQHDIDVE